MKILVLLVLVVVAYFVWKTLFRTRPHRPDPKPPELFSHQKFTATNEVRPKASTSPPTDWLAERWAMSTRQEFVGTLFPTWFYDPVTEVQKRRLEESGVLLRPDLTKGQASDLIGLEIDPDEEELAVLRFFKRSTAKLNQSRARHEIALIFLSEENKSAWKSRPVTPRRLEFFRFFGVKAEAGLLEEDAKQRQEAMYLQLSEGRDERVQNWDAYESILDNFDDADFRESVYIRRPSYKQIRSTIEKMLGEGKSWEDIDSDSVAERLQEENPNLQR